MRNKSLYLHMGPGMNAEPEKAAFSAENPHVHFWNQPAIHSPDSAFARLTFEAKKQIELLSEEKNKINLIAHCFGASIALECLRTHSDLIEECQFIAPTFCMNDFLVSLLNTLQLLPDTKPDLKTQIKKFLDTPYTPDRFWEGHSLVVQDPEFFRCYWFSSDNHNRYQTFAHNLQFDIPSFKNVVDHFIKLDQHLNVPTFSGSVVFFIGSQDPILKNSSSLKEVQSQFTKSLIRSVENAAHFPHFETQIPFI